MISVVILISGRGSNMEAIIKAGIHKLKIAAVISNRSDAAGLLFAQQHGIATAVVDHKLFPDRESFDAALSKVIDGFQPHLVVLAGFMRVLTEGFVRHYSGRLLNIHPSLLPSFPGLHTHRRALQAGVKVHGTTVHFVTPQLDSGPIVIQAAIPVLDSDDEASLAARVLVEEHRIYPQAVAWFASGRLTVNADGVVCLSNSMPAPGSLLSPALDGDDTSE